MKFEVDLTNAKKLIVQNIDGTLVECTIKNGTVTSMGFFTRNDSLDREVENLKTTNNEVKTINKIIKLDDKLDKIAKENRDKIANKIFNEDTKRADKEDLKDLIKKIVTDNDE